jgi:hypothetical protein
MRRPNRTFTLYDKDGNEWTIEDAWEHSADDVPLFSQLSTTTRHRVWSHVNDEGNGRYRVVETWEILTREVRPPSSRRTTVDARP